MDKETAVAEQTIPIQVAQDEQEADRLLKEMYPELRDETEGKTDEQDGKTEEEKEAAAGSEEAPEGEKKPEEGIKSEEKPEEKEQTTANAEIEQLRAELARQTQANIVLEGKYNAEVPRLAAENKELRKKIADLEAGKVEQQEKPSGDFVAQLKDKYGDDFLSDMDAYLAMKGISNDKQQEKKEEKSPAPAMPEGDNGRIRYLDTLSSLVPDWQDISKNPEFGNFLMRSGLYAQARAADDSNNAVTVASFYQAYKNLKPDVSLSRQPDTAKADLQKKKEEMIAPAETARGQSNVPPQKKIYSKSEVAQFYKDVEQQRFRGREAEQETIDRDISLAAAEGRIR